MRYSAPRQNLTTQSSQMWYFLGRMGLAGLPCHLRFAFSWIPIRY